jgi:hypothetical protein
VLGQGSVDDSGEKTPGHDGWRYPNGTWVTAAAVGWKCGLEFGPEAVHGALFRQKCTLDDAIGPTPACLKRAGVWPMVFLSGVHLSYQFNCKLHPNTEGTFPACSQRQISER